MCKHMREIFDYFLVFIRLFNFSFKNKLPDIGMHLSILEIRNIDTKRKGVLSGRTE